MAVFWIYGKVFLELAKVAVAGYFLDCAKRYASPGHCGQTSPTKTMRGCLFNADVLEGLCKDVVGADAADVGVGVV